MATASVARSGAQFVVSIVIARSLGSEMFGRSTMLGAIFVVFAGAAAVGLNGILLAPWQLSRWHERTLQMMDSAIGVLLLVSMEYCLWLSSGKQLNLVEVVVPTTASFCIAAWYGYCSQVAARNLEFSRIGLAELLGVTIGAGAGWITSQSILWPMCVIVQLGVSDLCSGLYIGAAGRIKWDAIEALDEGVKSHGAVHMLRTGGALFGAGLLGTVSRNVDTVVIGTSMGSIAVSNYSIGFKVMMAVVSNVTQVLTRILGPFVRRMTSHNESPRESLELVVRILCVLYVPCSWAIIAVGPGVVRLLYGAEYSSASLAVQVLALAIFPVSLVSLYAGMAIGLGISGRQVRIGIANLSCILLCSASSYIVSLSAVLWIFAAGYWTLAVWMAIDWRRVAPEAAAISMRAIILGLCGVPLGVLLIMRTSTSTVLWLIALLSIGAWSAWVLQEFRWVRRSLRVRSERRSTTSSPAVLDESVT